MDNIDKNYIINYFLYGTNSIFHNHGLSIYTIKTKFIDKHGLTFVKEDFENVKLTSIEEILPQMPEEERLIYEKYATDAFATVNRLCTSVARQGVLFSHQNLLCNMKPHIHRHSYSTDIKPSITVHYRLFGDTPANFMYYDNVTQQEAIDKDLCRRDTILQWCDGKNAKPLTLVENKNIILFNSALTPHYVEHTDCLNLYFVFDNVWLKNPMPEIAYSVPVIFNE